MGCIYFFKHNNNKYVKIGMTTKDNPNDRFNSFLTYAPEGGEMLGFFNTNNPRLVEFEIHKRFSDNRMSGEWFNIEYHEIDNLIKEFSQMSNIKRLLLDIPIKVKEENMNVEKLTEIRDLFLHGYLDEIVQCIKEQE